MAKIFCANIYRDCCWRSLDGVCCAAPDKECDRKTFVDDPVQELILSYMIKIDRQNQVLFLQKQNQK
ncbi:MAG: hypothetical protein IJN91_00680 [Alphaproteobacteria bacterium]|nr:hypothetical protein [Alphaproteobacteria bacterium]